MDYHRTVWEFLRDANENGTIRVKGVHILTGTFVEALLGVFFDPKDPKVWGTGDDPIDFGSYKSSAEYAARVAADPEIPAGFLKCLTSFSRDISTR